MAVFQRSSPFGPRVFEDQSVGQPRVASPASSQAIPIGLKRQLDLRVSQPAQRYDVPRRFNNDFMNPHRGRDRMQAVGRVARHSVRANRRVLVGHHANLPAAFRRRIAVGTILGDRRRRLQLLATTERTRHRNLPRRRGPELVGTARAVFRNDYPAVRQPIPPHFRHVAPTVLITLCVSNCVPRFAAERPSICNRFATAASRASSCFHPSVRWHDRRTLRHGLERLTMDAGQ